MRNESGYKEREGVNNNIQITNLTKTKKQRSPSNSNLNPKSILHVQL